MKRLFLAASGLFGAIPGLAVIASGIGVPPGYKVLFGGVIEAFGALALLLLWGNRARLRRLPHARLTRIVVLLGALALGLIIAYVICFNGCVITHPRGNAYYPLYTRGDLAVMVERGHSREGAIDGYGIDAVREAIRQMGAFPLALTTIVLLLLYQGIFTALTVAFGLAGLQAGGGLSAADEMVLNGEAAVLLRRKIESHEYDVFLCHNSKDKPAVKNLGERLKEQGIRPWLDEWELQPGLPWQRALERQIETIKAVAVLVGPDGFGPWQNVEQEAFLREFVQRGCPVIPVILPGCTKVPEIPVFLRGMTWVDFRKSEPNPLDQLMWGITGQRRG